MAMTLAGLAIEVTSAGVETAAVHWLVDAGCELDDVSAAARRIYREVARAPAGPNEAGKHGR
jgi:hypothetical protein